MSNVIGLPKLVATITAISKAGDNKELVKATRDAAFKLRNHIRAGTPKGPTGNLRRAVEAGTFRKKWGANRPTMSFVRVDRKIAPHTHLVEFGARGGKMPANPFFRRGVGSGGDSALDTVEAGVGNALDVALK